MGKSELLDDMLKSLEIRETKNLLSHEQTISKNLKRLKQGMLNIGHLVDPLVVDNKSNVVLDGNHRMKVLEVIECPYAACQVVDYQDPEIQVGTWYPVTKLDAKQVLEGKENVTLEKVDYEQGKKAIEELKAPFVIRNKEDIYLVNPGKYKLKEMVEEQVFVLSNFESKDLLYTPDSEAEYYLGKGYNLLERRIYTKEEIIKTAEDHAPFPPKSTRHLIPGRIIRLNMKLGWLHRKKEDATTELHNMLNTRAYAGNVRRYYESVVVIY